METAIARTAIVGSQLRLPPRNPLRLILGIISLLAASTLAAAGVTGSDPRLTEVGRRIYEEGVLPDGTPLRALRPEGFTLEGSHAACATCHRRSGMGSVEGSLESTILVPPISAPVLFTPARFAGTYLNPLHHYVPNPAWERALTRPAYDPQSLDRALRNGVDPGGKPLQSPMPRYALDADTLAALTAYLRQLGSSPAPGVSAEALQLATVVTPDVAPAKADAVLGVLRAWATAAHGAGTPWQWQVWTLTGPATEWPEQLAAYYRKQPVFALLSGIGAAEWTPIHSFCERHRLPCVLPSVEVTPETGQDFYSIYFSPGVTLEARILGRHLESHPLLRIPGTRLIQVYADASGRHAAELLHARLGPAAAHAELRRYRVTAPRAVLEGVTATDILVLWLRADEVGQLAAQAPRGTGAGATFISALLATPEALALPATWRQQVQYVSLFDDLGLQGEIARLRLGHWLETEAQADHDAQRRLQADAYTACYLFNDALAEIREQEVRRPAVPLSGEHVLETLEGLVNKYNDSTNLVDPDSHVAYYGRMSLGPRQRVAVRGGAILRYVSPDSHRLVTVSGRIVP